MSRGMSAAIMIRRMLWHALWLFVLPAHKVMAGQTCVQTPLSGEQLVRAAETANLVADALIQADRPVALLARVGNDLSKYGLYFSHVAVVLREHESGPWRVWHLLNTCGTDDAGIYVEGLFDYYARHLTSQDTKLVLLSPTLEQNLLTVISSGQAMRLFQAHYNVIAPPRSLRSQNSTAYILELLAAAALRDQSLDRAGVWSQLDGAFTPDTLRIPYRKRVMGGLFSANADFGDHPVSTRVKGLYPVVTVRSIFRYLKEHELATQAWVISNGKKLDSAIAQDGLPPRTYLIELDGHSATTMSIGGRSR